MKRISLVKIAAALSICNIYVFTCGVTGTMSSVPIKAAQAEQPIVDDEANGQGTIDFIIPDENEDIPQAPVVSESLTLRAPAMADKTVQSTFVQVEEIPEEAQDVDVDIIIPQESEPPTEVVIPPEETQATTAATTTSATTTSATTTTAATTSATTTTVTTTTASTTASTTTAASTKQPEESSSNVEAANEILTVMDDGVVVSGSAIDIVSRMTQNEVGYTFAPEAIKAQAVASYTYVKYQNLHDKYPSVGMSDSVKDSVRVLVSSVIGESVKYNGSVIQAVYSASSAGYTASSRNVWGGDLPYLVSKYCELDALYDPNYGRKATFTSAEIKNAVYSTTGISLDGDPSEWISIDDYIEGKYVGQMTVGGKQSYINSSGKTVTITGRVFREQIMEFDIRSSAFDVEYDEASDTFTFTTYGYGHGVGMSQNGANALATYWGYDYKQILQFYYTGCEVN